MKITRTWMIAFLMLGLLLILVSCERSAPQPTETNPEMPFPVTTNVMNFQTQTAMAQAPAKGPQTGGFPTASVPPGAGTPVVATVTPAAPATSTAQPKPPTAQPLAQPAATQPPAPTKAPAPVQQPAPVQPATRPETYVIQKGDSLYCLARRFDVDAVALTQANGGATPAIGTTVRIPASAGKWNTGPRSLRKHPDTYYVGGNESVNFIACQYGDVDPAAILSANGLNSSGDIKAGMKLNIP